MVEQWLRGCPTNRNVAGSIPAGVSDINIKSFRSHYGPGVGSASNRNEYQKHFQGGKGGWCVRLTTLPPSCAVVTKSGNLNFLEPSGPVMGLLYLYLSHSTKYLSTFLPAFFAVPGRAEQKIFCSLYVSRCSKNRGLGDKISSFKITKFTS